MYVTFEYAQGIPNISTKHLRFKKLTTSFSELNIIQEDSYIAIIFVK